MKKEELIKVRVDEYLKSKAIKNAEKCDWTLSQYIRILLMCDSDDPIYDHFISNLENVDTSDQIEWFEYQGKRFLIIPEEQTRKITEFLKQKKIR